MNIIQSKSISFKKIFIFKFKLTYSERYCLFINHISFFSYIINYQWLKAVLIFSITLLVLPSITMAQSAVTISEVDKVIPTYSIGQPVRSPMFFFGKDSQGAQGRVYPYPLYTNLTHKKINKIYHVVYLENKYVKIGIIPELGGRVISAVDKTNNYNFVYRQSVIKPELIGLIGAWISGGIEWNIPHHHRATSCLPVQWSREDNLDGSKTVWVGELEIRQRMSWAVGYTLHPESSVLECKVRIINRTPVEHTMLCFANVAVAPNDNYQVIFPPSTQWSTYHKKRIFHSWPVTNNVDVSWYKNNKESNSWFAVNYKEDFMAGYDHGLNAGTMSVADHNIVPGKKFFTWGVGSPWDKILSDDGRPYLELMVGAYSDNQPDYSWLQPFEERSFDMNFYPFRGIDGVKNANLNAAVNLDVKNGKAIFGFYTTKAYRDATVSLKGDGKVLFEKKVSINPDNPYVNQVALPVGLDEHDLCVSISDGGRELVSYSPVRLIPTPYPVVNTPPKKPVDYKNNEELFLAGQRIYQFHNATLVADPYYNEVLRRDSGNTSANTGMGILSLKKAEYTLAEKYFNKAIERLTFNYTSPKNVEPLYYLGVAYKAQGHFDEAFNAFYKATWKQEWKAPAYFSLAEIATMRGDFSAALDFVDRSLDANALNVRAYGLKAAILRHLNRTDEAIKLIAFAKEKCDPLDVGLMAEQWFATKDVNTAQTLFATMNTFPATAQEIAAEFYDCGLWSDGVAVLQQYIIAAPNKVNVSPLIYYYLGYFEEKLGDVIKAGEYRQQATLQSPEYVFPFQDEMITILRSAIVANPKDARAPYFLGNLLYDWQPEESIALWKKSSTLDSTFSMTWRNLSIAYSHKQADNSLTKSIAYMEKAIATAPLYPTYFGELDNLYEVADTSVKKRLAVLEKHLSLVIKNDEAVGDLITLDIFTGSKVSEAIKLMQSHFFSLWEGLTPFNSGQGWMNAYYVLGLQHLRAKKYSEVLADFTLANNPPENLLAIEEFDRHKVEIAYWTGCAYAGLGEKGKAQKSWNEVIAFSKQQNFKTSEIWGNVTLEGRIKNDFALDQEEQLYYVTLAKQKLGNKKGNEAIFNKLITSGIAALNQPANDSVNVPQVLRHQLSRQNIAMAHYIVGLGYAGLGNKSKARKEFEAALAYSSDYLNAKIALDNLLYN
jgi:tetratricopeptide (TPR) repeat protein